MRNATIPVKKTQRYNTPKDHQTVRINVHEGERARATDNNLVGCFHLSGIPLAPRGLPLNVCFNIDADGILNVSAQEETTGNRNEIIIATDNDRLSTKEIRRFMIQEAKNYEVEDKKFLKRARAKNALHDYIYNMEKALKDMYICFRLCPHDKEKISSAIAKAKALLDANSQNQETGAFEECLKEAERIFEPIIAKTGYSFPAC